MDRKIVLPNVSRRGFLGGLGAGAVALGGASLGVPQAARAGTRIKTLVYVFLRGGTDGLSLVPPIAGADLGHYMDARPYTRVDPNDSDPSRRPLALNGVSDFGLHPFATGLQTLFNRDKVAIIHAAGHPPGTHTRSHFDAQEQIELGTPGEQSASQTGWLTRHLQTTPGLSNDAIFTSMVSSSNPPVSLNGYPDVATLDSPDSFSPNSGTYEATHLAMLRNLYSGAGSLDLGAQTTVDAVDLINSLDLDAVIPGGGVTYPNSGVGRDFELVAALIKQDLGIGVATVDFGGWDTHNSQNTVQNYGPYGPRVRDLSDALFAFYEDLRFSDGRHNDVTIILQSEFGRQIKENANRGTDHGLGCPMAVISGNVNGGVYGTFPGLAPAQRISDSVEPTTDFRQVHATVLDRLMGNPNVDDVFADPTFNYSPMGFA